MLTTNYEEWREREAARLCLENPEVECPVCEGETLAPWEICESVAPWGICEDCGGEGCARYLRIGEQYDQIHLSEQAYLRTLRAELTEYCRYTGADFLGVIGREVSEQRSAGICL